MHFKRLQPGRLSQLIDYVPESIEWPKVKALGHNSSTLGGNSGSAVIDLDAKRVLAVHFAGQPFVTNWAVPTWELYRDPRIRDAGVRFTGTGEAPPAADADVERAWSGEASPKPHVAGSETAPPPVAPTPKPKPRPKPSAPSPSPPPPPPQPSAPEPREAARGVSVVVDIANEEICAVRVERTTVSAPIPVERPDRPGSGHDETTAIDPDWSTRTGYDEDFLGPSIPMPMLTASQEKVSVKVPLEYRDDPDDPHRLNYHHYSVIFHAKRRLAWLSAANIDGDRRFKFERGKDKWFIDDRIDDPGSPRYQMGEELYATARTDRGHLTRYLDVAWGDTKEEAIAATNDSFHFTNCALQLSEFNQSQSRWQGLERFLLEEKARKEKRRMCVFTGPVLKRTDPVYRNRFMDYAIRIPMQFWKVCTLIRPDDTIAATAFVLGQPDVTETEGFEEKLDAGACQVTLAHLQTLTGLDFGRLKKHDHLAAGGHRGTIEAISSDGNRWPVVVLRDLDHVVV